jgi:O-antigen/teichoic acid export membrane protein
VLSPARFIRLTNEAIWLILAQAIGLLGSFVFIRLITNLVSPTDYGQLALALTLFTLCSQLTTGLIASGVSRTYTDALRSQQLNSFFQACRWMLLLGGALIIFICASLALLTNYVDIGLSSNLVFCIAAYAILHGYYSIFLAMQNAARKRKLIAFCTVLDIALRSLCALAVVLYFSNSSGGIVFGFAVGSLLTLFILHFLSGREHIKPTSIATAVEPRHWVQAIWRFAWPITISGIFSWSYFASQRWSLEAFTTTTDVGQFYLLTQIGYAPVSTIGASLISFVTPVLYNRATDHANRASLLAIYQTLKKIVLAVALFFLSIFILLIFYSIEIVTWIANEQYQSIASMLPFVMLAASLLSVSHLLGLMVGVQKLTHLFLFRDSVGNLLVTLLNLCTVYFYGMQGLVFSMVLGATLHLLSQYIIVRVALRQLA